MTRFLKIFDLQVKSVSLFLTNDLISLLRSKLSLSLLFISNLRFTKELKNLKIKFPLIFHKIEVKIY